MRKLSVALLVCAAMLAACGGHSEKESRYLTAVRSSSATNLSDEELLQAGHDVCSDKQIGYISDLATQLEITGAAMGYLC